MIIQIEARVIANRVLTHLAKSQQNNGIDCNNNFISHEKILGKEANFFLNLRVKNVNRIIIRKCEYKLSVR